MKKFVPLPHEWMLVSILGFFLAVWFVWNLDKTWGFTFAIFFVMTFLASIVSMGKESLEEEHLNELSIHHKHIRARKK